MNDRKQRDMRLNLLRILKAMARCDPDEWKRMMGFPAELPNLRKKDPPGGNSRPNGIEECFYERRVAGQIPEVYE